MELKTNSVATLLETMLYDGTRNVNELEFCITQPGKNP